jgi:hypothetical protein
LRLSALSIQEFCRFELPARESVGLGDVTQPPTNTAVTATGASRRPSAV